MQASWDCSFVLLQKRHMGNGGDVFPRNLIPEGVRIFLARLEAGLTQEELARLSGVSRRAIIAIEPVIRSRGDDARLLRRGVRIPHATTVRKLARILLMDEGDPFISDLVPTWPRASVIPHGFGELSAIRSGERKLTQAELAAKVGVHASTISRFERNMPSRKFYCVEYHPDDGPHWRLKNRNLAIALGFRTIAEHENWCREQ